MATGKKLYYLGILVCPAVSCQFVMWVCHFESDPSGSQLEGRF